MAEFEKIERKTEPTLVWLDLIDCPTDGQLENIIIKWERKCPKLAVILSTKESDPVAKSSFERFEICSADRKNALGSVSYTVTSP